MTTARIGPNAIWRLAEALQARSIDPRPIFDRADLARYLERAPETMVAEDEVSRLYAALHEVSGTAQARSIADDAGQRTADYLLAKRIPKPAQTLLKLLPSALAARLLLSLIGRHSWTFAGSAEFRYGSGRPLPLTFINSPFCRRIHAAEPVCDFYCGTFRGLFRALVTPRAEVHEIACSGRGDDHCRIEVYW